MEATDKDWVLKLWQVTEVACMQDQEASEVRGGVVADDCGVGKTIQTLALIYQQWQIKFDFAKYRSGFKNLFAVDTQNVVKACGMTSAIGQSLALIV